MSLKHRNGRIVVYADLEKKNSHRFEDGTTIRVERQYNNFNKRETEPVNAVVISSDSIPEGAEVLVNHNALHEINKIYDYKELSGEEAASDVKHFSLPESDCFLWRENEHAEWKPIGVFATALRIFKPYDGILDGIEPTLIKDMLYVTSGEYKGLAVKTIKASDYEIIFQNEHGREERIIRFRPNGDEKAQREPEAILIDHPMTSKVNDGALFIGLSTKDCKPLSIHTHA
jgi:hypothetical protein